MNATAEMPPPVLIRGFNPDAPFLVVRIKIPSDPIHGVLYPIANRIGSQLLCSLFVTSMELEGVRVHSQAFALDLNRTLLRFHVSNPKRGMELIKARLEAESLLCYSQIAWYDSREEIMRPFFPLGIRFEMPTAAELARFSAELKTATEQIAKLQRGNDERNRS